MIMNTIHNLIKKYILNKIINAIYILYLMACFFTCITTSSLLVYFVQIQYTLTKFLLSDILYHYTSIIKIYK